MSSIRKRLLIPAAVAVVALATGGGVFAAQHQLPPRPPLPAAGTKLAKPVVPLQVEVESSKCPAAAIAEAKARAIATAKKDLAKPNITEVAVNIQCTVF